MATRAHAFGAGRVLGRSLPIWARNIVKFTILYAFVYAPLVAYAILAYPRFPRRTVEGFMFFSAVVGCGWLLLWFIAPLAVIHGVLQELQGERASFKGCLRVYLTRLFPALGVGLTVGFFAVVSLLPASALAAAVAGGGSTGFVSILVFLPAAFVASVYWVAVPVAASERRGVGTSLQRSARLTKGSRASVFAIVLVVVALHFAPLFVLPRLVSAGPLNGWLLLFFLTTLGSYGAVVTSVAYHDLRLAKDGVATDDLVRVFA